MIEKRAFERFSGKGFIIRLNNELYNVIDLSVYGIKIENISLQLNSIHNIILIPRNNNLLQLNNSMSIVVKTLRQDNNNIACVFAKPTFSLMKIVVNHMYDEVGGKPFIFK